MENKILAIVNPRSGKADIRKYIDRIGFDSSFIIFDASDQKSLVKQCLKELNIDNLKYIEYESKYISKNFVRSTNKKT